MLRVAVHLTMGDEVDEDLNESKRGIAVPIDGAPLTGKLTNLAKTNEPRVAPPPHQRSEST
jgi:hypothetical protein